MSYCTVQDVERHFKNLVFKTEADLATQNECGEVSVEDVEFFIRKASALIDSYLCDVYCVPLEPASGYTTVPENITELLCDFCTTIAAYRIGGKMNVLGGVFPSGNTTVDYHNQDTPEYKYYKQVIKHLEEIRACDRHLCGVKRCEEEGKTKVSSASASGSGSGCCARKCPPIDPCLQQKLW